MTTQIEQTILQQLGGRRFAAMTGAKNFIGGNGTLSFRLPSNFASQGINAVRVTLEPSDTYSMEFLRIRGTKVTSVAKEDLVYFDMLQAVFARVTGLATSL